MATDDAKKLDEIHARMSEMESRLEERGGLRFSPEERTEYDDLQRDRDCIAGRMGIM